MALSTLDKIKKIAASKTWYKQATLIGIKIIRELKSQKISQKELADRMGKKPQWISRVVKGQENLTLGSIYELEEALGISLMNVAPDHSKKIKVTLYQDSIIYDKEDVFKSMFKDFDKNNFPSSLVHAEEHNFALGA